MLDKIAKRSANDPAPKPSAKLQLKQSLSSTGKKSATTVNVNSSKTMVKQSEKPSEELLQLIQKLHTAKDYEFFYLKAVLDPGHPQYNPYDLAVVPYQQIDHANYYTISKEGIIHFFKGTSEFCTLERWRQEYDNYHELKQISFFKVYEKKKYFELWAKTISREKFVNAQNFLSKNLFFFDRVLMSAFSESTDECQKFKAFRFAGFASSDESATAMTLKDFLEFQASNNDNAFLPSLKSFNQNLISIGEKCCSVSLAAQGFGLTGSQVKVQRAKATKMFSYTEQAANRNACRKLLRFAKIVDFLFVDAIHHCLLESVVKIGEVFKTSAPIGFDVELLIVETVFGFYPGTDEFLSAVDAVLTDVTNVTEGSKFLVQTLKINAELDEDDDTVSHESPHISEIISSDPAWNGSVQGIRAFIKKAFKTAAEFTETLNQFLSVFVTLTQYDYTQLKSSEQPPNEWSMEQTSETLVKFAEAISKVYPQIDDLAVPDKVKIEILTINTVTMKASYSSVIKQHLDKLRRHLRLIFDSRMEVTNAHVASLTELYTQQQQSKIQDEDVDRKVNEGIALAAQELKQISEMSEMLIKLPGSEKALLHAQRDELAATLAMLIPKE